MKKTIALVLVICLAALLFAACADKDKKTAPAATQAPTATQTTDEGSAAPTEQADQPDRTEDTQTESETTNGPLVPEDPTTTENSGSDGDTIGDDGGLEIDVPDGEGSGGL